METLDKLITWNSLRRSAKLARNVVETRVVFERSFWQSVVDNLFKPRIPTIPYVPERRRPPKVRLNVPSAWKGIEEILEDLIERFHVNTEICLEFGVEFGFSTVALSSFFNHVIGIDTFHGDKNTDNKQDIYQETVQRLSPYKNITLVRSDYRDFARENHGHFGLIHVDIVHTFADTFACGLWSARHSQCTIFHDTQSYPQVRRAVREIARATNKQFFNFKECRGLGILV
jgi:hypothetical protein